jgi:hypothetical protein
MKLTISRGLVALTAISATPGIAQDVSAVQAAPAPALVVAAEAPSPMLRTGTELPLRLLEELTTEHKSAHVGDRFRLETAEPLIVNGVTVIPVGTPAVGEITEVRNKGMWGKSGHIVARLLYVSVNGRQIRLTGDFDDKGRAGGAGAVAVSALVFVPAGFFMTGTSARMSPGLIVKSFIDEDVPLVMPGQPARAVLAAQPAPVAAPIPAAVPSAPAPALAIAPVAVADSGAQARCWSDRTC